MTEVGVLGRSGGDEQEISGLLIHPYAWFHSSLMLKEYSQGQITLFPASLESKIPQDSPVRLVNQIVDKLDISKVIDTYKGGGTSSCSPRMMLKVVIYAYLNNIYSCRKIENALLDRSPFMWLSAGQEPDHNTIKRFRSKNLKNTIHAN
jgi:transposase